MNNPPKIMSKRKPSMADCAVRPLDGIVHRYLLGSYLLWPLTFSWGYISSQPMVIFYICVSFAVMGFLLYNLLVAMVQMSHKPKKRLRIGQWLFFVSLGVFLLRVIWVAY
ncbi:MAG: hypothetical protein ACPG32_15885 [Akkermansiaceae bacterium]